MLRKRPRGGDDGRGSWEVSCSRFGTSISELSLSLPSDSVAENKRRNGLTALAVGSASAACVGIPLARSGLEVGHGFPLGSSSSEASKALTVVQGFDTWEYAIGAVALLALVAIMSLLLRKALTCVVKGAACFRGPLMNTRDSGEPPVQNPFLLSEVSASSSRQSSMTVLGLCDSSTRGQSVPL